MTSLHFESSGSGPPVLALHGYGATLFSWRDLPQALPDRRVIRVDLPGHGASPPNPDGRYALADHAAKVAALVDELRLYDFDLIGHSMGGGVALLLACDFVETRPGAIRSLTLVDGIALPQPIPWFIRLARLPIVAALARRAPSQFVPSKLLTTAILREAFFDRDRITSEMIDTYAHNLDSAAGREALALTARQIIPDNLQQLVARYHNLQLPTLLIWGEQDRIVPPIIGISLNAMIDGSKLSLIEKCGHIPHEERPDIALPTIAEFLKNVRSAA